MKYIKKILLSAICFAIIALIALSSGSTHVFADDNDCSITIKYYYGETPLANASFSIYKVGSVSGDGSLILEGDYKDYPVNTDYSMSNASDMAALAMTLYGYTALDSLSPSYTAVTNDRGIVKVESMAEGVYLLVGEKLTVDGNTFVTDPQLITLPWRTSADSEWVRSLTVEPKYSRLPGEESKITVKVLKKWDDNGSESTRPEAITVYLLRDGELYDTVSLTAEASWRHTWEDLDGSFVWTVVEEVPTEYTVIQHREGVTRLITNSKDTPTPPTEEDEPKLPQTGMLLWPIPILALGGISLIIAGIATRKGEKNEA